VFWVLLAEIVDSVKSGAGQISGDTPSVNPFKRVKDKNKWN
jgi:hypothetical protein